MGRRRSVKHVGRILLGQSYWHVHRGVAVEVVDFEFTPRGRSGAFVVREVCDRPAVTAMFVCSAEVLLEMRGGPRPGRTPRSVTPGV